MFRYIWTILRELTLSLAKKVTFNQAHCKLPEDGPDVPKHVGANIRYFNVNFNILYVLKKFHLLVKRNFEFFT